MVRADNRYNLTHKAKDTLLCTLYWMLYPLERPMGLQHKHIFTFNEEQTVNVTIAID